MKTLQNFRNLKLSGDGAKDAETLRQQLSRFEEYVCKNVTPAAAAPVASKPAAPVTGTSMTSAELAAAIASQFNLMLSPGIVYLDNNGNATVANANTTATSKLFISPVIGNSGMPIAVTIAPGVGITLSSGGGARDANLLVKYILWY